MQPFEQRLYDAFQIEKVQVRAFFPQPMAAVTRTGQQYGQAARLLGQLFARFQEKNLTHLENLHPVAEAEVGRGRLQGRRQQTMAHNRPLLANGIGHHDICLGRQITGG